MSRRDDITTQLNHSELCEVLRIFDECLVCTGEEGFHRAIRRFADFIGFEFVLYGYVPSQYEHRQDIQLVNLSNPVEWMNEYAAKGYLDHDPVRIEFERRLAQSKLTGSFVWDNYKRRLSALEEEVVERRKHHGLRYGFSAYTNSQDKEAAFLVSFARPSTQPDEHALLLGELVVPHLNRCRKRIGLLSRVQRLTERERIVAQWVVQGKTNWEIAQILGVTSSTAKFHVANILTKLEVNNRQNAISILLAERYLS